MISSMQTGKDDQVYFLQPTLDIYLFLPFYRFEVSELMILKANAAPKSNLSKNTREAARFIEFLEG